MKFPKFWMVLAALAVTSVFASAATLTGTVTNGTTGKPAAGDDVVLLQLSQGMNEQARTKTDSQGRFKFEYSDDGGPHLVRVLHQGVNYFPKGGPIMPGGPATVDLQVFEVAKKVEPVSLTVDMMRVQAENGMLEVAELWAVNNQSSPPRTQMNDRSYEIELPEGAQIDSGMAASPGGQPIQSMPVPLDKTHYYFTFPLRPGETRFQVAYHVPYSGQATFSPKPKMPVQHIVVMLPKSMHFTNTGSANFQPMGEEQGGMLQVATNVAPGQNLSFKVTGAGLIADTEQGGAQGGQQAGAEAGGGRPRPGGGLGPPEETPDPLHKYRWPILGGLGVLLAVGGFYVTTRPQAAPATAATAERPVGVAAPASRRAPAASPDNNGNSTRLLDALKEEMFQLELDRHQGRISPEEYEKSKAALDLTLSRAAARAARKS